MVGGKKKPKTHVYSKLPPNPVSTYNAPDLKKIAVNIDSDEDYFIPRYDADDSTADLFLNSSEKIVLSNGSSTIIDCGFSLKIPMGYRICIESCISGVFLNLTDSNRVKVNVFNFGKEITLQHKQKIGKIWIEPVYFFDWIIIFTT